MRYFSFFFFFSIFFSCYFFFLSALSLFSFSLSLPSSFSTIQRRDNTEGAISRSIPCHCLFLPSNTRGKSFLKWPWEGNVDACDDNAIIWKDCLKSGTQENHDDFCETTTTQSKNDLLSLKKRISCEALRTFLFQNFIKVWREDGKTRVDSLWLFSRTCYILLSVGFVELFFSVSRGGNIWI